MGRPSIKPAIVNFIKANPRCTVDEIIKGAFNGRFVLRRTVQSHLCQLRTAYEIETSYEIKNERRKPTKNISKISS